MNYTIKEIQTLVNESRKQLANSEARELVIAENDDFATEAREVYKDKKIKRLNDISRDCIDEEKDSLTSSPLGEVKEEGVSVITPATTSSRAFTGITIQHCRTNDGVKLAINIQTQEWADNGQYLKLTAELKRWNRLRELKGYSNDSYEFAQLYSETRSQLKNMPADERKPFCMGRLHERGKRAAWVENAMAVAQIEKNKVIRVILNIEGCEYDIAMDQSLSENQAKLYHSSGIYGQLKISVPAPSIWNMKRTAI